MPAQVYEEDSMSTTRVFECLTNDSLKIMRKWKTTNAVGGQQLQEPMKMWKTSCRTVNQHYKDVLIELREESVRKKKV